MFGYVMANASQLSSEEKARYGKVYCGICRALRLRGGKLARLGLQYDMAFLALLLMSLYEPQEQEGSAACRLHPIKPRPWVDGQYIRYAADMNLALAYYKSLDDAADEGSLSGHWGARVFGREQQELEEAYPRQCAAIRECIEKLSRLEAENCPNPDLPAACFGELMGQLFVYHEDMWKDTLYQMGTCLGRYIYLADAAVDYRRDRKKKNYNPFLAMGQEEDLPQWEQYLTLTLGRCTDYFERLPLVQDKGILDNILYSGVWLAYGSRQRRQKQ